MILGDKGFAGRQFEAFVREELGAELIRPDRKDEPVRLLALATAIWHNWRSNQPVKRSLTAYDH